MIFVMISGCYKSPVGPPVLRFDGLAEIAKAFLCLAKIRIILTSGRNFLVSCWTSDGTKPAVSNGHEGVLNANAWNTGRPCRG